MNICSSEQIQPKKAGEDHLWPVCGSQMHQRGVGAAQKSRKKKNTFPTWFSTATKAAQALFVGA